METIVDKYGVEYDIKQKILIKASPDLREEYIIHQNTEIIHPFAFMDCKKIKSIVLPDKLQYIGSILQQILFYKYHQILLVVAEN